MNTGKNNVSKQKGYINYDLIGGTTVIAIVVWIVAAWFTHVISCFIAGTWGFLIAGAIMFPIAIVHGTGIWFGLW